MAQCDHHRRALVTTGAAATAADPDGGATPVTRRGRGFPPASDRRYFWYMHPGAPWPAPPGPWPAPRAEIPRRFDAVASPSRALGIVGMVASIGLFGGFAALASLLPKDAMRVAVPICLVLFFICYSAFIARALRSKKVVLDVDGGCLRVDEGRAGVYSLSGAALGLWRMPGSGVAMGTALHLAGGKRRLVVGGRDHRPGAALRLDAPPVEHVDMLLPADAFEALLASVPSLASAPGHAAPGPLRCALMQNPASVRGGLWMMAPWLLTIAAVSGLSLALGELGVFDSAAGQMMVMPLLLVIIAVGLVVTVVRSARKRPALEIEADRRELRLRDPRTGRLLAAAPLGAASITRGISRIHVRTGTFEHAVLVLRLPGHPDVTLGVQDTRFAWADAVPRLSAPRYVVGSPDWNALVEILGLRRFLVVHDDHVV